MTMCYHTKKLTKALFEGFIEVAADQQQRDGGQVVCDVELQEDLGAKECFEVVQLAAYGVPANGVGDLGGCMLGGRPMHKHVPTR